MKESEYENQIAELKKRIAFLEKQKKKIKTGEKLETVSAPKEFYKSFNTAEKLVGSYFNKIEMEANKGSISIDGERYVLMRASALSYDFLEKIKHLYKDKGEKEAVRIGQNFLFDISHVIGLEDAKAFHKRMNLIDPISKLTAGPVHFAYSGWAKVEILEGNPSPDENYYLKFNHPYSFEAESWISKGIKSEVPVCTMNAGYSSGWCEESFGIPLTTVELTCKAKGDDKCTFIMAHPDRIQEFLNKEKIDSKHSKEYEIPLFFERKKAEQKILKSLEEKSILLKEVHHRVKNNLQIISSLLNLQSRFIKDKESQLMFNETKNRIKAIALVHEKLYKSSDVQYVNLKEYVVSIVDLLKDSFESTVEIKLDVSALQKNKFKIDKSISFGLIINELISNSLKYAFRENEDGIIDIKVSEKNGVYTTVVKDNGKGLPSNFSIETSNSLGFEIITTLIEQLDGSIDLINNSGTSVTIKFKG